MKDEVVLFVGFDDKPYHEFLGERSGEEHFKAKGILFERWQVIHLGVPFLIYHPYPADWEDLKVRKTVLRAIHKWASQ